MDRYTNVFKLMTRAESLTLVHSCISLPFLNFGGSFSIILIFITGLYIISTRLSLSLQ